MRSLPILFLVALVACEGDSGFITYDEEPTVTITDPNDGSSVNEGTLVDFGAVVNDDAPGVTLIWSSDLDGTLGEDDLEDREATLSIANLSAGLHTITLTAVDSAAQSGEDSISIEVIQVAEEPVIVVVHPASGEIGLEGVPFSLQAQVADEQDDPIEMRLSFSSDVDGVLCADVTPDLAGVATCSSTPSSGGHTLTFIVTDSDGLTAAATALFSVTDGDDVDNDGDGFTENQNDCNDANPAVNPNAPEFYNGVDDDGDGFTELNGDCDDTDPLINPNATEFADGIDNDCDGLVDNNTDDFDDDGDGFSEATGDCDDNNISISPNAADIPYNGVDEDCDGSDNADIDNDGFDADFAGGTDCDDTDSNINPGANDDPYNGEDEDCDGSDLTDVDGDGFDADVVFGGTDCDDLNPDINTDAVEIPYDGIDQDCQAGDLLDFDGDGQNAISVGGSDCNDTDPSIFLGAPEIAYDGIDQDCDGSDTTDADGDGYDGMSGGGNDCNDADPHVNPGEPETPYNGIDDDCAGGDLTDVDGDGVDGPSSTGADCNDDNSGINPNATEIPYNGIDEDCSGSDLRDVDGDGFESSQVSGADCDDNNPNIRPSATESCDGIDNNCSGGIDEANAVGCTVYFRDGDGDGYGNQLGDSQCLCAAAGIYDATNSQDCYDSNAQARPSQTSLFSIDRGDGSFDYDCNNSLTYSHSSTAVFTCNTGSWPYTDCDFTSGWQGGGRPACGSDRIWGAGCSWVPVISSSCDENNQELRTQSCR